MPRTSTYTLTWSAQRGRYELYEQGTLLPVSSEGEAWLVWLATHSAFAFQGRQGNLTLLKESRARSAEGYWYAYRSLDGRTSKKYLGRSSDLNIARLEQVAGTLAARRFVRTDERNKLEALATPLLAPKLRAPQVRSALIARARLLERLDSGLEYPLTLLCAPAGFGKTTLAGQWIADRGARADFPLCAWVSLDTGDNDPLRFWLYIITACRPLLPDQGEAALARIQAIPQPPFERSTLETALTIFLNGLAHSARQGVLVLEDYHVISEPRIHETLTFLLDHLPPTLRLVMSARGDPALPLARLRARGELRELRAGELRFSRQEMEEFLQQEVKLPLSEEMITHLATRLEGWAAGLRLVALALQRQSSLREIERFLASLAGSHRSILEYFVTEVLEAQPEPIQRFLLATSPLTRLAAPLCDAVTESDDSAQLLATLERANLFLEPLDDTGEWYRYHALFAESMRHEARRRRGEAWLSALSAKASRWYEQQGQFAEAVESALQAHDYERCADLVERMSDIAHLRDLNEFHTMHRWLEQLPEELFETRPALCLSYAMTQLFVVTSQRLDLAVLAVLERRLHAVEQRLRATGEQPMLGQIFAVYAMLAWRQGNADHAADYARSALALLPTGDIQWRGTAISVLARVELLLGRFEGARRMFQEALAFCEPTGNQALTRATTGMLGGACLEQGALRQATAYLLPMLAGARAGADFDDICHAQLSLAHISYERNDLATAWQQAHEVFDVGTQIAQQEHTGHARLLLARVAHARGESEAARQQLSTFLADIPPHRLAQQQREGVYWLARFQLAAGDLASVQYWFETRPESNAPLPVAQSEREELLLARLWIAQGRIGEALAHLAPLLTEARAARRTRATLETQALMALAYYATGQNEKARGIILETLALARPEEYLRLFLDEGTALAGLLRDVLAHTREKTLLAYVQHILRASANEPGGLDNASRSGAALLNEPLSAQETRVLRLLAAGYANAEIAREFVVSVNTVRTQVQSIYRKLNVSNRVAASEAARDYNLI